MDWSIGTCSPRTRSVVGARGPGISVLGLHKKSMYIIGKEAQRC